MHDDAARVIARVHRLLKDRIEPAVRAATRDAVVHAWEVAEEPVPFDVAVRQSYRFFAPGDRWGREWGTTWLRVQVEVPVQWRSSSRFRVEHEVDLGFSHHRPGFQCEGLVYSEAGIIIKGVEPRNRRFLLPSEPGRMLTYYVEAASNPDLTHDWTFVAPPPTAVTPRAEPLYRFEGATTVLIDSEAEQLAADVRVLLDLVHVLPSERPRHARVIGALRQLIDLLGARDVSQCVAEARAALAPVLTNPATASAHAVVASGHAHIDSAWLWPTRETVRKCARTFSNVLALMDEFDDFVFACSSAQQFVWVRDHYPELFERITTRVHEGRFIPVGGMWVESDTNMPSGESLVRQFLEGGRTFRELFGFDAPEAWLPDSFGYSAALPQIATLAGARWLLTQKMSWNDTNRMPHHTFWWEGIDGTRIFTHFPPADTYTSDLSVDDLDRAERQFADKEGASTSLLPFGYGNGGGGPTREMMHAAHRLRNLEGAPRVTVASPRAYFAETEREYGQNAPTWSGEMYLELHRGIYTTQARTKQGNRRCEELLHEAELWATHANVSAGLRYPAESLRELWRTVLLNQFHDILPGSSIARVHAEAERAHNDVARQASAIIDESLRALAGQGDRILFVNSTPFAQSGSPAMSVGSRGPGDLMSPVARTDGGWSFENDRLRVVIDRRGFVSSLYDTRRSRELIPPGEHAGVPLLLTDMPTQWDGWDMDLLDQDSGRVIDDVDDMAVEDNSLVISRRFGASRLQQRYSLGQAGASLDLDVEVDWAERDRALKLAFPLDLKADSYAAQTQFGHVMRPMTNNTSWEHAQFESCAHRFVHIAEHDEGAALVNTATYGHDVSLQRSPSTARAFPRIRPTLLRGPRYPDATADLGRHHFGFSLVVGTLGQAVEASYLRNAPIRPIRGTREVPALVRMEDDRGASDSLVIETVKLAEDGSGDVIVRVYEPHGGRARGRLAASFSIHTATEVDLHEKTMRVLDHHDDTIPLAFTPFQLRTLRLTRSPDPRKTIE